VSANFSDSIAVVEKNLNVLVCTDCVLQIANGQNILATSMRDRGDLEGTRRVLLGNSRFLRLYGAKYNSKVLLVRGEDNKVQASNLDAAKWARNRKIMRQQQNSDAIQQGYDGTKR